MEQGQGRVPTAPLSWGAAGGAELPAAFSTACACPLLCGEVWLCPVCSSELKCTALTEKGHEPRCHHHPLPCHWGSSVTPEQDVQELSNKEHPRASPGAASRTCWKLSMPLLRLPVGQ